ncbi:MAG: hypothetical protein E7167_04005 [Firmicutes bacterium]|nr:hypothetical protein [Bacillota bacterium]
MDISNFMSWFVSQVVSMFTWAFNLLDSITFGGTSLLKVLVTIMILVPLLSIVLTLFQNMTVVGEKSGRISERREQKRAKQGKSRWI